jgi:hypothetical protein
VVLLAVVLLAVNDQVLKQAAPSWWTGKLSDAAGLVVAPVLAVAGVELVLGHVVPRRALAAALGLVGAAFVAVQLWSPADAAYEVVFGAARWPLDALVGLVAGEGAPPLAPVEHWADAEDLLALPALAVPWLLARPG